MPKRLMPHRLVTPSLIRATQLVVGTIARAQRDRRRKCHRACAHFNLKASTARRLLAQREFFVRVASQPTEVVWNITFIRAGLARGLRRSIALEVERLVARKRIVM